MSAEPNTTAEAIPATAPTTAVEESKPAPAPAPEPAAPSAVVEESKAAPGPEPERTDATVANAEDDRPTEAPEKDAKPAPEAPVSPLTKLAAELPSIIKEADQKEIWGIELADEAHVPTSIVLEKFLRANNKDVAKAKIQLKEALVWRKKIQPLELVNTEFDKAKFEGLGFVTVYNVSGRKEIITWNIYGSVKDNKATFGNTNEFIKWRCALMELSVKELDLASATEKIPENGPDPYRMVQVHDYQNVSFLRMDPNVKAASKEIIQQFSVAYPELLKEKFFVNVPLIMGWVFSAMKLFLSAETIKKFHPLSSGKSLASELPSIKEQLPEAYGGKGADVRTGLTVQYATPAPAAPEETKAEEAKQETKEEPKEESKKEEVKKEEVKEEAKEEAKEEELKN